MSKTTALHVYHAFYYIPLTSTTKGSVLHNTGAWFPLVALELVTGYTTKCPSSETQGQLVGKSTLRSRRALPDLTVIFDNEHSIAPTTCPWVSEDTKCHAGANHPGMNSPACCTEVRISLQYEIFATVPCKREMTTRFAMKMVCRWTKTGSAWVVLVNSFMLVTERGKTCKNINTIRNQEVVAV